MARRRDNTKNENKKQMKGLAVAVARGVAKLDAVALPRSDGSAGLEEFAAPLFRRLGLVR